MSTTALGPTQASAAAIRITAQATPGAGAVVLTSFALQFAAATA